MTHSLTYLLSELALYAQKNGLLCEEDETFVMKARLSLLHAGELPEERAPSFLPRSKKPSCAF